MFLAETELKTFRNYTYLHKEWHAGINIFLGNNAQGKTNLLESIYILALGKSHRTTKDKEWIAFNAPFTFIKGKVIRRQGPVIIDMTVTDKGKKAKINGLEQRRMSDFIGTLNAVMFAPEDLDLVKGTPHHRRRFMDMEIGQVSPMYLYNVSNYNKIVMQRNQLLKEIARSEKNSDLLDVWDEQLIEYGIKVVQKRMYFIEKLKQWTKEIHSQITNNKEELTIRYDSTFILETDTTEAQLRELYSEQLRKNREREIYRGVSLIGPHRDDLIFFINDQEAQSYGSQGQQRTAALSVKLAEIEMIQEEIGEYPILLLDDVFSELDDQRQSDLLKSIKDKCQTFITTTSIDGIAQNIVDEAQIFHIQAGEIVDDQN